MSCVISYRAVSRQPFTECQFVLLNIVNETPFITRCTAAPTGSRFLLLTLVVAGGCELILDPFDLLPPAAGSVRLTLHYLKQILLDVPSHLTVSCLLCCSLVWGQISWKIAWFYTAGIWGENSWISLHWNLKIKMVLGNAFYSD